MFTIEERPLLVKEITELIKQTLEPAFRKLWIKGEISNFRPSSAGHLYFTLKDKSAVISCVMFRSSAAKLGFKPSDGQLVEVKGNLSVYEKRGSYQIICSSMTKSGQGDILAMLEERKRLLAAEGLFDSAVKKTIPLYPSRIALITSPTGAAVRDILNVTRRRGAGLNIIVMPAPVQGAEAPPALARQIERVNEYAMADVIILSRGGGSLEDLLPFSDEAVVRAVAASEVPIISAVGHDIDTSLSDLAADLAAPTPSAAAELVSAGREELLRRITTLKEQMTGDIRQRLENSRHLLQRFTPESLEMEFRVMLQPTLLRLDDAKDALLRSTGDLLKEYRHRLTLATRELEGASPQAVLDRGFAVITSKTDGTVIRGSDELADGQEVAIRLARGSAEGRITHRTPAGEEE